MIKQYEKYIDSGSEWVGKIPKEWSRTQLKYISSISKGRKAKEDFQDYLDGMIPYLSMEYLRNQTESPSYVYENDPNIVLVDEKDLLILWDGSKAGEIVKAKNGALSSTMGKIHLESDVFDLDFLSYYLKSAENFIQANTVGMGIPHVSGEILRTLLITYPLIKEQVKIARYLDHQTDIIDQLIQQKEKLISLLKEKRQAVINEAVTKGLDPNAKMKDSGFDWLGEVPAEWEVTSIKNILEIPITDGPHTTPDLFDDGIPFISAEAIKKGKIDFNKKRGFISEKDYEIFSKKYVPRKKDIYMVKSGATTGNVAMVETNQKFTIWSPLAVFRANSNKVLPEYLHYYLQSNSLRSAVEISWSYGTQQNIGMGVLSNISIAYPEIEEQIKIVSFVENSIKKIENLELPNRILIEKLKEYRQSIISEAVTGKIDVREWASIKKQIE